MVRELQPDILVNDRLGMPGDFVTPEQYQPSRADDASTASRCCWEACQTLNGSWGYDRDNLDWKSADLLVRMLIDSVAKDGNLLLNVGPNARGEFDPRAPTGSARIGEWMRLHERSIYGCGPSAVHRPARLPLHPARGPALPAPVRLAVPTPCTCPGWPAASSTRSSCTTAPRSACEVIDPDATAVNTTMGGLSGDTVTLDLPVQRPDVQVPVIELFLT